MKRRSHEFDVPETRVGICCGCRHDPLTLFKLPGLLRWRCADCFEREAGFRHHLAPMTTPARIILP